MEMILDFKGKKIRVEEVIRCSGLKKASGLMFRGRNTNALLFDFGKETNLAIHSLFCPKFLAVWLNGDRIVDTQLVKGNRLSVKSKKVFTKLLEIPIGERYHKVLKSCNSDGNNKV